MLITLRFTLKAMEYNSRIKIEWDLHFALLFFVEYVYMENRLERGQSNQLGGKHSVKYDGCRKNKDG